MRKAGILFFPVIILLAYAFLYSPAHAISLDAVKRGNLVGQAQPARPDLDLHQRMGLAYPPTLSGVDNIFYRSVNADMQDWTPMNFVGDPVMLEGRTFAVEDVKIINGGDVTKAYAPELGEIGDTPIGAVEVYEGMPVVFIPPNSSLVMVKIMVEPQYEVINYGECWNNQDMATLSGVHPWNLRIAYPGVGEFEVLDTFYFRDFDFGIYDSSQDGCLNSGWYYFYLPVIDPDPQMIWLTYSDLLEPDFFTIWSLTRYH